jgi:ribosomal-protein-alanine N-acetyltransferase
LRNDFQYEGLLRSYRMVRGQPGDFNMYAHVVK